MVFTVLSLVVIVYPSIMLHQAHYVCGVVAHVVIVDVIITNTKCCCACCVAAIYFLINHYIF